MNPTFLIARNAVRENLRRRVLHLIVLFVVALVAMVQGVARFEAQVQAKMVKDLTYAIVSFFALVVVLISTFDQIPGEVESKTLYLPLARPIPRRAFVLGKYLGIIAVMFMFLAAMGVVMFAAVKAGAGRGALVVDVQMMQAFYLLGLKYICWASLLLLMSVVTSRPLAVVLSLFVFFFGHVNDFLAENLRGAGGFDAVLDYGLRGLNLILPKFSLLDPPGGMIYKQAFSNQTLGVLTLYASAFAALYLLLAVWAFSRKEL